MYIKKNVQRGVKIKKSNVKSCQPQIGTVRKAASCAKLTVEQKLFLFCFRSAEVVREEQYM